MFFSLSIISMGGQVASEATIIFFAQAAWVHIITISSTRTAFFIILKILLKWIFEEPEVPRRAELCRPGFPNPPGHLVNNRAPVIYCRDLVKKSVG